MIYPSPSESTVSPYCVPASYRGPGTQERVQPGPDQNGLTFDPTKGEHSNRAWNAMRAALGDGRRLRWHDLIDVGASVGPLGHKRAENMLYGARKNGWIDWTDDRPQSGQRLVWAVSR